MSETSRTVLLKFDPALDRLGEDKSVRDGMSAVVVAGETLWAACDETTRLERFARGAGDVCEGHEAFPLSRFLALPAGDEEEADIEGLDLSDGWLWLVGSHSLKRGRPKKKKPAAENRARLAEVTGDGNRYLLARIPLEAEGRTHTPAREVVREGRRLVAARLGGDAAGNDLTAALREDGHFRISFETPGKDNGFDVEGLAVSGERVILGLRGPVLRGWSALLELAPVEDARDPATLRLEEIGEGGRPYRKHFLDLGGLGVRDLCVDGEDLLLLAGPTMDLDGPVAVFRWRGGAAPAEESFVFRGEALAKILDVPHGAGDDHAEGLALLPPGEGGRRPALVLYDAPSAERKRGADGEAVLRADIFELP